MMYLVDGIRHQAFVQASSPAEAIKVAREIVQDWELSGVFLAEWINGILQPVGGNLLEQAKDESL